MVIIVIEIIVGRITVQIKLLIKSLQINILLHHFYKTVNHVTNYQITASPIKE